MRCLALGLVLCSAVTASGDDLSRYTGNYRLGERVLAIAEWETDPAAPHVLAFTDLRSGRFGVLTESGPNTFALHEGVMAGPVTARIRFVTQGERHHGASSAPDRWDLRLSLGLLKGWRNVAVRRAPAAWFARRGKNAG